jgi:hypothetical protein
MVVFTILYNTVIRYLKVKHSARETTQRYYNQRISLLLGYISFLIRTLQMALDSSNNSDLTMWSMGVQLCEICPFLWYNIVDEIYDKIFKHVWKSCQTNLGIQRRIEISSSKMRRYVVCYIYTA